LYQAKALGHGVVRQHGRGVPPQVVQKEEKNVAQAERLRGTTKVARMINSRNCPDLLSVSVYDTKPVHLLAMVSDCVEWSIKRKKVWSEKEKKKAFVQFLRLNMIDDYNHFMNSVDVADQLRGVYRPDHWMWNRKWWWAIWLWGLGVARTNAYKIYQVMYDEELKKNGLESVPPQWTHARFIEELVYDLMFPDETAKHLALLKANEDSTFASSVRSTRQFSFYGTNAPKVPCDLTNADGIDEYLNTVKPNRISQRRLEGKFFTYRLDGQRHCTVPARYNDMCQLCFYTWNHEFDDNQRSEKKNKYKRRNRDRVSRCLVCNVNLCQACELKFHGVDLSSYCM
jgi:hypothetical protein